MVALLVGGTYSPSKGKGSVWNPALPFVNKNGLILEFGVAKGSTINMLAKLFPHRAIHGFDSFDGLPADWLHRKKGAFKVNLKDIHFDSNVEIHVGLFKDTLPGFVESHKGEHVSLLHIDCDLYESTKEVFDHLREMIRPGTVIFFDEIHGPYAQGLEEHEAKAFKEYLNEYDLKSKCIAYNADTQASFVIKE